MNQSLDSVAQLRCTTQRRAPTETESEYEVCIGALSEFKTDPTITTRRHVCKIGCPTFAELPILLLPGYDMGDGMKVDGGRWGILGAQGVGGFPRPPRVGGVVVFVVVARLAGVPR